MDTLLLELKGLCAKLLIYEDGICIKKWGQNDRIIKYPQILSIDFKSAGLDNGYIHFNIKGEPHKKVGSITGQRDPNTIIFNFHGQSEYEKVKLMVEEKINSISPSLDLEIDISPQDLPQTINASITQITAVEGTKPLSPEEPIEEVKPVLSEQGKHVNIQNVNPSKTEQNKTLQKRSGSFIAGMIVVSVLLIIGTIIHYSELSVGVKKPVTETRSIVCNKFKLSTEVKERILSLSVDTDLPNATLVMVDVSRSYWEKGNPNEEYSIEYFSEKSTIGKWKTKHNLFINDELWKSALKSKQEEMSRLRMGFDVGSIGDSISVHMVVPQNAKLTGKSVKNSFGIRVVEDEVLIKLPLNSLSSDKSTFPSLNPSNLDIGQTYIVSKQTPIMPSQSPTNPIEELSKMKIIPIGGGFKVLKVFKDNGNLWYRAMAFDEKNRQIGTGWIKSIALLGQNLKVSN